MDRIFHDVVSSHEVALIEHRALKQLSTSSTTMAPCHIYIGRKYTSRSNSAHIICPFACYKSAFIERWTNFINLHLNLCTESGDVDIHGEDLIAQVDLFMYHLCGEHLTQTGSGLGPYTQHVAERLPDAQHAAE